MSLFAMGRTPAQAAAASGRAAAGHGGASCGSVASCSAFEMTCKFTQANDVDASVRAANIGGQLHAVTWNATLVGPFPAQKYLVVLPFKSDCSELALKVVRSQGEIVAFPPGTAYVAVWPIDAFQDFTFNIA
jgi:hypothetical protein